jgi:hypothetical protein
MVIVIIFIIVGMLFTLIEYLCFFLLDSSRFFFCRLSFVAREKIRRGTTTRSPAGFLEAKANIYMPRSGGGKFSFAMGYGTNDILVQNTKE